MLSQIKGLSLRKKNGRDMRRDSDENDFLSDAQSDNYDIDNIKKINNIHRFQKALATNSSKLK